MTRSATAVIFDMVVEDSTHGVRAGKAAGMAVIGFSVGGHCGADHADRLLAAGADHDAGNDAELSVLLSSAGCREV